MSPNRVRFIDFRRIKPKGVKAADKTVFMATGSGCMKINVPNGKGTTAVVLQDVLYCLDLGYTLHWPSAMQPVSQLYSRTSPVA